MNPSSNTDSTGTIVKRKPTKASSERVVLDRRMK
jgi:hypothetical protein